MLAGSAVLYAFECIHRDVFDIHTNLRSLADDISLGQDLGFFHIDSPAVVHIVQDSCCIDSDAFHTANLQQSCVYTTHRLSYTNYNELPVPSCSGERKKTWDKTFRFPTSIVKNVFIHAKTTRLPPTDKMADYLIPPTADIEGSPMHSHWTNYKRIADMYVAGNEDAFVFVSYTTQQSYNEQEIQTECNRIGEGMKNLYRQSYNRCIVKFRKTPDSSYIEDALEYLEDFKNEDDDTGTLVADECTECGEEPRIGEHTELCADCYWSEDSYMKRMRRNAIPSGGEY